MVTEVIVFFPVFMQQVEPSGNVYTALIYGDSHPLDDLHCFLWSSCTGSEIIARERREGTERKAR